MQRYLPSSIFLANQFGRLAHKIIPIEFPDFSSASGAIALNFPIRCVFRRAGKEAEFSANSRY